MVEVVAVVEAPKCRPPPPPPPLTTALALADRARWGATGTGIPSHRRRSTPEQRNAPRIRLRLSSDVVVIFLLPLPASGGSDET